jgi:16S rRNA (guanine527-N7)-methyltransferase
MTEGPAALDGIAVVSRESLERFALLERTLRAWQSAKNLVGPATLDQIWSRHIADSLQLAMLGPLDGVWADFGSGAGFPGLVIAIAMLDPALRPPGASPGRVHLVESNGRKGAFLREAARVTGAPVMVHAARVEAVSPVLPQLAVVTARALAPLTELCAMAHPHVDKGAIALFPKGQDVDAELTEATRFWNMEAMRITSRTSAAGQILKITRLEPRSSSAARSL